MNLSTNIKYFAMAAVASMSLCACNDISGDDRFIELPHVEAKRVVLLEEFTGQKCTNCPEAHEVIAQLLKDYPDGLVAVSIHSGGDAFSFSEDAMPKIGLRTADGQMYCDSYNVPALPAGVVNRKSGVLTKDGWEKAVREEMAIPSNIDIKLAAELIDDGKKIAVTAEIDPYDNFQGNLQLWVLESDIKAIQYLPANKRDVNYVHNNVFRGTVNGHDGEPVTLVPRESSVYTYTVDVRNDDKAVWNVDNLSIVGFIYNKDGVYQTAITAVK